MKKPSSLLGAYIALVGVVLVMLAIPVTSWIHLYLDTTTTSAKEFAVSAEQPTNDVGFSYSLANWCFQAQGPEWDLSTMCQAAKKHGCDFIDLSPPEDWVAIREQGLKVGCALPSMGQKPDGTDYAPFEIGLCHPDPEIVAQVTNGIKAAIDSAKESGVKFALIFTGMEVEGQTPAQARNAFVTNVQPILAYADEAKTHLVLEMLNTRETGDPWRSHPGYIGDSTAYCVDLVKRANQKASEAGAVNRRLGLVTDFYHIQMMDEDPLQIIEQYGTLIDYVHVAGVFTDGADRPTRSELHVDGQTIDYPAVMEALTGLRQRRPGLKEPLKVCLEYIPFDVDDAEATIGKTVEHLESWREH